VIHLCMHSGDPPLCAIDGKEPVNGPGEGTASLSGGLAIHYIRQQAIDLQTYNTPAYYDGAGMPGSARSHSICNGCYRSNTVKRWMALTTMGDLYG
jgi:hypothetical protein